MKPLANSKGYSFTEFIVSMMLLMLLGLLAFSLMLASNEFFKNAQNETAQQSEIRLAVTYLNTKIRQNDQAGVISVQKNPVNALPSLVIRETYDGTAYNTWIYAEEGSLWEATLEEGTPLSTDLSFQIAQIDRFDIQWDETSRLLKMTVGKSDKNQWKTMDAFIRLRGTDL